jgi:hypothetical protein
MGEDMLALTASIAAVFVPVLAVLFLVVLLALAVWLVMRARRLARSA